MSAILQQNGNPLPYTDGTLAPDHFDVGLPYTAAAALAVDDGGAIDHTSQGLPFTAAGRLAVEIDAVVDRIGNGAAPFGTTGLLSIGTGAATHFNSGVPYDVAGRVVGVSV